MPPSFAPSPQQQLKGAHHEVMARLVHMAVPWAVWLLFTFLANIARLVAWRYHYLDVTSLLVLALGTGVAVLDWHLRASRMRAVARWIGPLTTEAGTLMFFLFLLRGYDRLDVDVWLFGGVAACLGWDLWMHASQHDLTRAFALAAQGAGLGRAQLTAARQPAALTAGSQPALPAPRKRRAGRGTVTGGLLNGTVHWADVTPAAAAAAVTELEGRTGLAPGALVMSPNPDHAAVSDFKLSDPRVLEVPRLWPGPSAPGADLSVPFRLGLRQDGELFTYPVCPVHHVRASGRTGSGKTMSWLYNFYGEAVTREGFAGVVIDLLKGRQFAGPLEPALHGLALDVEQALAWFEALARARKARLAYMAATGLTEWRPGCGLTLLNGWLEEAPSVLNAVAEYAKGRHGHAFTVADWCEGIKGDRSSGTCWGASMQLGHHTEFPVTARGQMGCLCFGTADENESKIGLSAVQRQAGARPELWRSRYPGKAYMDTETIAPADVAMPVRFFSWGSDASVAQAYFAQWPAGERPVDDITGEAFGNVPTAPPSYGLPGPGGTLPGNVTRLADRQQPLSPGAQRDAATTAAVAAFRDLLCGWLEQGRDTFTTIEVRQSGILERHGRSRTWVNQEISGFESRGWVRKLAAGPNNSKITWKILPAIAKGREQQEEA